MVWGGLQRWESGELVERARSAGVVLPGFIAQEDLPALYRQAGMLVYPSLYEGFGLPPLEAMACGTPVVASNTSSLPEAVGEAALTVDPTHAEEIAAAMARLLDEPSLRQGLRQAGIERAREFTWRRTAQRLLAALKGDGLVR
jgi:glycosyltransferase involved in cell wall biosynthesis